MAVWSSKAPTNLWMGGWGLGNAPPNLWMGGWGLEDSDPLPPMLTDVCPPHDLSCGVFFCSMVWDIVCVDGWVGRFVGWLVCWLNGWLLVGAQFVCCLLGCSLILWLVGPIYAPWRVVWFAVALCEM